MAAVLGGGLMGAGISHVSVAKAKVPVRIKDVSTMGFSMRLNTTKLFDKQRKRCILSKLLQSNMLKLSGGVDFTRFNHTDIVVEAVFEDLELKQQMVADVEANAYDSTIFATNTSSLPIHKIAEKAQRPEKVGPQTFSPVENAIGGNYPSSKHLR